ncbi:MAG TPA: helix-hairpin-helix domain-containing protein [Polyangiaceae bacterium]
MSFAGIELEVGAKSDAARLDAAESEHPGGFPGGGRVAAPAACFAAPSAGGPGVWGRIQRAIRHAKRSVWAPVLLKMVTVAFGMTALAGIGAASVLNSQDGVLLAKSVERPARQLALWLSPGQSNHVGLQQEAAALAAAQATSRSASSQQSRSPKAGRAAPAGDPPSGSTPPSTGGGITPDGKVILNIANADELTKLPGIGKKRAADMVQLRTRLGRFRTPNDLLRVRGIGPKTLRRMLPHLVLDPPSPDS